MPAQCKVCALGPAVVRQLESDWINGVNVFQLYKKYGPSNDSIHYHLKHHLPKRISDGMKKDLETHSSFAIEEIHGLYQFTKAILQRNYDKQWDKAALKAIAEARGCLQLMAQIEHAHYQSKLLEIESEKSQSLDVRIPLERLTQKEQDMYFKLTQKLMGDDITIDLGYGDTIEDDLQIPKPRKRVVQEGDDIGSEDSPDVGASEVVERNKSKYPAPGLKRKKLSEDQSPDISESKNDKFKPLEEWNGKTDPKLRLRRRRIDRAFEDLDDPYSSPLT